MHKFQLQITLAALLIAAPLSALANTSIAAEAATNSLTAIDVLLLPDQTMVDHAKAANLRLRSNYPQGFLLDATHHPHITLLQSYVRTKDLDTVYAAVQKALNRERPNGWELEAIGYYYLNFNNVGLVGIVIRPTPHVLRLQQAIIEAVAPHTESDGTVAAYVTTPEHPVVNEPTLQYVNTFIPERIGKHYNPHVTVGVGHLDFAQTMKAAPFENFRFKVAGAAVFHLGNYGTAQNQLWGWKVPDKKHEP
jgi:hypothetical protein